MNFKFSSSSFFFLILRIVTSKQNVLVQRNQCASRNETVPVCNLGFTLVPLSEGPDTTWPLCERRTYSNVEWRCIQGKPFNNKKCRVVEEYMAEIYCKDGDVLLGMNCYGTASESIRVTQKTRFFKWSRRCQVALPRCQDNLRGANYTSPLYPALTRCRDPDAIINLNLHSCSSAYYWDKVPVCAGSMLFIGGNGTTSSSIPVGHCIGVFPIDVMNGAYVSGVRHSRV